MWASLNIFPGTRDSTSSRSVIDCEIQRDIGSHSVSLTPVVVAEPTKCSNKTDLALGGGVLTGNFALSSTGNLEALRALTFS